MFTNRHTFWIVVAALVTMGGQVATGEYTFTVPEVETEISVSQIAFTCGGTAVGESSTVIFKIYRGETQKGEGTASPGGGTWAGSAIRSGSDWGAAGTGTGKLYKFGSSTVEDTNDHITFVSP
jgi:hypothetical protein